MFYVLPTVLSALIPRLTRDRRIFPAEGDGSETAARPPPARAGGELRPHLLLQPGDDRAGTAAAAAAACADAEARKQSKKTLSDISERYLEGYMTFLTLYKVSNSGLNTPYSVKKCYVPFYIAFKNIQKCLL